MKISVCVPMYNEEKIAADCAKTLHDVMSANQVMTGDDFEIIFCDDGSIDNCGERVRKLTGEYHGLRVVGYPDNRGKGSAVREAIAASEGDIVMYLDCDLAYGTDVVPEVIRKMKESDYDIIIGSRNLTDDGYEGYTPIRKLASKTYIKVLNLCAGFHMSDSQCGFKTFRGDIARKIFSYCRTDGFAFDIEAIMIAEKMKLNIGEIPVKIINHRDSKINVVRDTFKMLGDLKRIKKRVKKLDIK